MSKDKKYHIAAGFLIATLIFTLFNSLALAFAASLIIGIAKEIYDKISGKGTVEVLDTLATILGGAIATGIIYLIGRLL